MSGVITLGALFGPDESWSIRPGQIVIRQSLRGASKNLVYRPANIGSITVAIHDWDSRPPSYYLAVGLVTGKQLKSPEFGTEAKAKAAMDLFNTVA